MKREFILSVLFIVLIIGCSGDNGTNATDEESTWWGSPPRDATWQTIPDCCNKALTVDQNTADSVCIRLGYVRSAGYKTDSCWVSGYQEAYLSEVACSNTPHQ